ncbi:unnamed protein product [Pieris macdunnoughi]|uniref:Chitin-binding type-2 domain-containing protein n=1 Tax=Pieris macdunnoughi TaxID=345717 RepID=A0A821Y0D9_9NEOP|nr:unnamed protein product [Pieris macdunnoughi]
MWFKILLICIFCFTRSLTTSFDLGGVISGNRMAGVPLGRSLGHGEVDVEGICTGPGMACQNCTHAVTCIPLPIGWLKVPLQQCPGDQTCNAHLGQCSTTAVPECDVASQKYDHTCEQVGIFPDAYDCRKFHLCSPPKGLPDGAPADHTVALCPRHYGYNPQTAQCSILLPNGQCTHRPVPDCQRVGHSAVLEASSNHYFVCLSKRGVLTPQIFICPHGWHFANSFCRPFMIDSTTTYRYTTTEMETTTESTTEHPTTTTISRMDQFFSTDKPVTYAADTFLADKFDLSNYETFDETPSANDFPNSFEDNYGREIWE